MRRLTGYAGVDLQRNRTGRPHAPHALGLDRTETRRVADANERAQVLERLQAHGGLAEGAARAVARETGVPEGEVYGAGSFFHLLAAPETCVRICSGLSCQLAGADALLERARASGLPAEACSCLAACDRAPAALVDRKLLCDLTTEDLDTAQRNPDALRSARTPTSDWVATVGTGDASADRLAIHLAGEPTFEAAAFERAAALGPESTIAALEEAGLQGRGGAGFPAAIKWRSVHAQNHQKNYVVLNADEGEPGTFKDREVLRRRPDLVLEGLAIAAATIGAEEVYLYLRAAFSAPRRALERAIARFETAGRFPGLRFHLHTGHGAYICGEETALLEAIEGRRGMPRLKPPFPTERGLWQKPTLIQNVETIACVPAIILRGGAWFRSLGRTEPGTKLYSVSGHVHRPGVYELPLGVTLDELVEAAGGYVGTLQAFSPGGASSGFLPASERTRPLDFSSLKEAGSMLGSAGVVVLNDTASLWQAVRGQLAFFERESCGQCAPCRIGTRFLREATDRFLVVGGPAGEAPAREALGPVAEVAWEMNEGSICGLGQAAALPLQSALRHFGSGTRPTGEPR